MNKYILPFFLLLSFTIQGQSIGDIFKMMPNEILPGVSEGNKTMLIVDSANTSVPYIFGEIKKVSHGNDYLKIETSELGNIQLKLLPISSDSMVLSVINTVCGGTNASVCNSIIKFYTTNWEKLDNDLFISALSPELFMDSSKKDSDNYKYALSLPDIYPISATFSETSTDLKLVFHYKERLTGLQLKEFEPYLSNDTVVLEWDGTF